jgi:protein-L-isoaspartate(D-aspartate) O-methyltransferase
LEVGAGTGYNAALLSALVGPSGRVVTVEIDAEMAGEAEDHLSEAGPTNTQVICGSAPPDGPPADCTTGSSPRGVSDLAPAWLSHLSVTVRGAVACYQPTVGI